MRLSGHPRTQCFRRQRHRRREREDQAIRPPESGGAGGDAQIDYPRRGGLDDGECVASVEDGHDGVFEHHQVRTGLQRQLEADRADPIEMRHRQVYEAD